MFHLKGNLNSFCNNYSRREKLFLERRHRASYKNTLDNLHNDLVFKEIFGTQKNVRFTEYLLELLKGYERHSLKGKVKVLNEVFLDKTKLTDKGITSDVLAEVEDEVINLEMYTAFDHEDFEKSLAYLTRIYGTRLEIGDRYQKQPKVTQYNFCKSSHVSNIPEFETDFLLIDRRTYHIITDKLEGYIYRLDKLENVAYDDNRKEELLKLMKMIYAKSNEERLEIAKGSEILMDLAQVMKKFVNDETILEYKSLARKNEEIARKDGIQTEKHTIAKNLLKLNIDISTIMQSTGLSKREILKLQENC